jgi:hypothetical protein
MSNYQLKRDQHLIWPQLTKPPLEAVSILPASRLAQAAKALKPDGIGPSPAPAFPFLATGCLSPIAGQQLQSPCAEAGPRIGSSHRRRFSGKEGCTCSIDAAV